jgi:hypothetical protein
MTNVDPLPAFAGKTVTGGRLNIYKALAAVQPATSGTLATFTPASFSAAPSSRFGTQRIASQSAFDALESEQQELVAL